MATYAVIETGGKQYRVSPGDVIDVERLKDTESGQTVEIERVLLLSMDGQVTTGAPLIPGARVTAKVERAGKGEKIAVFKYKRKVRYRRKTGHRQLSSRLSILRIETSPGT